MSVLPAAPPVASAEPGLLRTLVTTVSRVGTMCLVEL